MIKLDMADINIRLKAEALGQDLEDLGYEVQQQLNDAIKHVVEMGYGVIVGTAELGLHSSQKEYLAALKLHELGENEYLIILDGDLPNALEKGYAGHDIKQGLLSSKKMVGVGPRAGQPWVQKGADGQKFAHVPFQHRPFAKASGASDLSGALRKLKATNLAGIEQNFTKLFTDSSGNPLEGKVARAGRVKGFPELSGVTKYQKVYKNEKTGKEQVQSLYLTFRTVSESGESWTHPGFKGLHAFDAAERWIDTQIDQVLDKLLK